MHARKPEAQPKRKVGRPRKNPGIKGQHQRQQNQQPPKKRGRPPKQKAPPVAVAVESPSAEVVANGPLKESQAVVVEVTTRKNGIGGAVLPPSFPYIHTSPYEELYTAEHGEDLFEQVALLFDSLHDPKKFKQVREAFARFGVVVSGTSDAILEKASEAKQLLESEKVWKDGGWIINFGSEQSSNNEFPTSLLLLMFPPEKIASASVYQLNEILSLSPCPLKQVFGYFDPGQEFALLHRSTSNAVRTVPTRKAAIFLCRAFLGMKVLGWKSLNETPNSSQTNGVSHPISSHSRITYWLALSVAIG